MKSFDFPGLSVIVPDDLVADIKPLPPSLPDSKGFKVIRPVANVAIYEFNDVKETRPIMTFTRRIEIYVQYTDVELNDPEIKRDVGKLKLAFWDGSKWVVFKKWKHSFRILPPGTGNIGLAKVSKWAGDPPIAWGK
jgi:hypothetical protein